MRLRHVLGIAAVILTTALPSVAWGQASSQPVDPVGPVAASAPAGEPSGPASPGVAADDKCIRLQYQDQPISLIVRALSQKMNRPLIGDYNVQGTITFFDSEPYTVPEAFDTVNILLAMRGYRLVEEGRYLRLVPIAEVSSLPVPILKGMAAVPADARQEELVTMLLPLKYISAEEAAKATVKMVSSYGMIAPLAKSKGLLVTDRLGNIQRINQMLCLLDTQETGVEMQMKVIELKQAPAHDVAQVIDNLWGANAAGRKMIVNPETKKPEPAPVEPGEIIRTAFDERTNTLMIMGEGGKLLQAEEMVKRLDQREGPAAGDIRVFVVRNASAEDIANTIKASLPQPEKDAKGKSEPQARIAADAATNRIIVSAPVDQMAQVEKLITDLDQAHEENNGTRIFHLKSADAQQMANIITAATAKRDGGRRGGTPSVSVAAEQRTNTLVISGSAGDLNTADKLIQELDRAEAKDPREVRVVQLKAGDVRQIAQSLMHLLTEAPSGRGGAQAPSNLRIEAEPSSNSLIIAAAPADWPTIEKVLSQWQTSTEPEVNPITRLVPLKAASATELANTLRQIYESRNRSARGPNAVPVVIAPSERANSLLISAAQSDQETIAKLIEQMDVTSVEKVEPVTIIELKAADARELASTLTAMLPPNRNEPQKVFISADVSTNSVLLRAPEGDRKMIEEMIARLDKSTSETARETQVHPLKTASASGLAPMLMQLYTPAPQMGGRRNQPAQDASERVLVTAAPGDKALVIDAPKKKIQEIVQLVESLDTDQIPSGQLQPRTYSLSNANAAQLAQSLTRLFAAAQAQGRGNNNAPVDPQPRFEAEPNSNQLLVAATAAQFELIDKLIQKMEKDAEQAQTEVRLFALKNAQAGAIVNTVKSIVEADVRARDKIGGSQKRADYQVSVDDRTNAIIVTAPAETLKVVEQMMTTLDAADAQLITTKIIELQNADAGELSTALNAALAGQGGNANGQGNNSLKGLAGRKLAVVPSPGSRALLLTGKDEDISFASTLITKLDERGSTSSAMVKTYKLQYGKAEPICQVLNETLVKGQVRQGRPGQPAPVPVSVTFDAGSNALVVSAGPEVHQTVAQLLTQLDTPDAAKEAVTVELVKLVNGEAEQMATALNSAAGIDSHGQHSEPKPGQVQVTADEGSNSLLLTGHPADIAEKKKIIEELDKTTAQVASQTKVFPLKKAKATEVADVLQKIFTDTDDSKTPWFFYGSNNSDKKPEKVRVAAAAEINSVVVQGPPEKVAMAEQLIQQFDTGDDKKGLALEVVPLKNAQAISLADAVNQMLSNKSGNSSNSFYFFAPPPKTTEEPVVVTAEPNSNSVLVRGPAREVPAVVEMIHKLDGTSTGGAAQVRTYRLQNNDAAVLADSMGKLFKDMIAQMPKPTGRANVPPPPFTISADVRTNSLVVSTTPAYFAMFEELLAKLEKEQERPLRDVQYVTLHNADPFDVATKLNNMFLDRKGPDKPIIEPDYYSNALTIIAKDLDYKAMQPLIEKMDVSAPVEVRVMPVAGMRAEKLAEALVRVYPQISDSDVKMVNEMPSRLPTSQPATQSAMTILRADDGGAAEYSQQAPPAASQPATQAAHPAVVIAVDKSSNSLIVSATRQEMDNIQSLITQLTLSTSPAESEIRQYDIKQADPQTVASTLEQLFNPPKSEQPQGQGQGQPGRPGQRGQGQQRQGQQPPSGENGNRNGAGQAAPAAPPQITVAADPWTRSVFVRAKAMDFELIEPVIRQLDRQTTVPTEVRIFALKNTDAVEVVSNLRELFNVSAMTSGPRQGRGQQGPQVQRSESIRRVMALRRSQGAAEGAASQPSQLDSSTPISFTANRASNSVVVSAPADAMEMVADVIQELDQSVGETTKSVVRLYPIKSSDVGALAATIQQVFSGSGQMGGSRGGNGSETPLVVTADEAGRLLIVSAAADKHELIAKVIADIEQAKSASGLATVKVYRIINSNAQTVAASLLATMGESAAPVASGVQRGGRGNRGGGTANAGGAGSGTLRISADSGSNSIVVSATAEEHQRIAELLKDIDSKSQIDLAVRTITLKNADASAVAGTLNRVFAASRMGGRSGPGQASTLSIEGDADSRTLLVRADDETFAKITELASTLDVTSTTASEVFVLPLQKAKAAQMAAMVNELYQQQTSAARAARKSVEPLAVTADERANALVLACSQEQYKKVSQWISQIEQMNPQRGLPRVIMLDNADPTEVQKAIQQIYGTPSGSQGGKNGNTNSTSGVQTSVLSSGRQLLIDAGDEDFQAIQQLVATLDAAAKSAKAEIRVFQLQRADNTRVAAALTQTFTRLARQNHPEDQVTVSPIAQSNAVVVAAVKEKMEDAARIIEQLDVEQVTRQMDFKVYPLQNAQPTQVMSQLTQMLAPLRQNNPNEPITVTADERTRSIIVSARQATFEQIDKIILAIDQKPAYASADMLVIPLKKADASRLAAVLQDMLRPNTAGQITPEAKALQEQVKRLRVARARNSGEAESLPELDLTKPIKVSADPGVGGGQGSNSLIITSTPDNLKALQAIVELMDTVPVTEEVKVQLVHLNNADAQSVVTVLREIFTQGQQRMGQGPGATAIRPAEPEGTSGKALVGAFNVSADPLTNTLVVSGTDESLKLANLIIADLDRENGQIVTEIRLFKLKNADATRLVPVLQAVFAETNPTGGGAAAAALRTQVTRLRTVLTNLNGPGASSESATSGNATSAAGGNMSEIPKARAALTIQADPTTNVVVVAARSDVMPLIADVIQTMDIPGAGSMCSVRVFPLMNADATRLQGVINGLYTGPSAAQVRAEDKPVVQADTRTNALIVCTSDKTYAMLTALIAKLDEKSTVDMRDIRLVPLQNADAGALAATLQKMMDARVQRQSSLGAKDAEALRVLVLADPRSNSLMVGGSAEGYQLVKDLAGQLDTASPALSGTIQILPLKEANAGALATTLTTLFTQRYAAAQTPDVARQKPVILPDLRTNSLLVAANQDDNKVIQNLLTKLDTKLGDPSVQLVVLPLKNNDAGVVASMVQQLFQARLTAMAVPGAQPNPQDRVEVAADSLSNSLIVSASKENLDLIKGLLEKVDVLPADESGIVRLYPLKNADAQRVATMIQSLVTQGLYKPALTASGTNRNLQAREKVSVAVDSRTNVLIISASKENFAVLEEIIKKIDSTDDFNVLGDMRMYSLQRADSSKLAPILQQFFDRKRAAEQTAGSSGRSMAVTVISDIRTNTLLVAGSRESFAAVEAMIKQLDGDGVVAATEFKVFILQEGTATAMQPIIQQLMAQRISRGQPLDPVTVAADELSNSIIVGASPSDMALVESLIARLDVPAVLPNEHIRVFPLKKADATMVAKTIRELTTTQVTGATGTNPATAKLRFSVDERINALIATGGENDLDRVAQLVEQLDSGQVERVTEIHVFTLKNADAQELATLLTQTLTNRVKSPTLDNPNRQTLMQFITQSPEGQLLVTSALQEGVLISADRRSNSLVVTAPVDSMPLLSKLIESLDSIHPPTAEIRTFALQNADADQMADVLKDLFRLTGGSSTSRPSEAVSYTLVSSDPRPGSDPPSATIGSAEQYALTVTVDPRTNTLLVGGTKAHVELVARVIQELDSQPGMERASVVYHLRNAQAKDIESAVQRWLTQERQLMQSTMGSQGMGSSTKLEEHEVSVVAVTDANNPNSQTSNTLLISASPRYFPTVEAMIKELDQPPPQVLIQVLLAEVTLDDTTELGVDWNATFDNKVSMGTSFGVKPVAAAGTTGTGTGSGTGSGTGGSTKVSANGFNLAVTGGDLSMFLRALQSQGRLKVLSRPQVLASDNQQASINVGQRVPFVNSSNVSSFNGSVYNTIQYEDVGIGLKLTPRISPDGSVRLEVAPTISSLSSSSVQISNNLNAVIINSRTADTTVTVQDGHTIVLGGLITTTDDHREDKVPVLGDIPLLGLMFKNTKVVKARTELLIILTPQVIRNVNQADVVSNGQVQRAQVFTGVVGDQMLEKLFNPVTNNPPSSGYAPSSPPPQGGLDRTAPTGNAAPGGGPVVIPLNIPAKDDPTQVPEPMSVRIGT